MSQLNLSLYKNFRAFLACFAILLALCLGGCQASQKVETPSTEHLTGVIISVDKARGLVTVKHDAIPGKMDAMTMPFSPVNPAALSELHKGDKISADMSVRANGAVLDNIKVLDKKTPKSQ